jgi:hypothetical protein
MENEGLIANKPEAQGPGAQLTILKNFYYTFFQKDGKHAIEKQAGVRTRKMIRCQNMRNEQVLEPIDMTIHRKALEEHFSFSFFY